MDVTFCEDRLFFLVRNFQVESVNEESNCTSKSTNPSHITLPDSDPHPMLLATNQVPRKTYYKRNLRKEIESPTDQLAPVQNSESSRDQGMTNPIESCVYGKMSENDRSDIVILKDMGEKDSVDETEIRAKTGGNEVE
ncbi:reverse transcriptase [Cucumis melo var. makuwa]|uniref:Reverse transcriptase n=1 Tax=Cucumis melo var. makuwa TaxID=1194695 RepID=A0A5D3E475_CUCMM|nr:reverse transcriptase [Cucumis melo var. makuwa]